MAKRVAELTTLYAGSLEARAVLLRKRRAFGDPMGLVGPRLRGTWEQADEAIRRAWPGARPHGSVLTWHWSLPGAEFGDVVGEAWPVKGPRSVDRGIDHGWWFRVRTPEGGS